MSKVKLLLYCTKAKPYLRDYRGKAIFNRFVISPTDRPFTSDDYQPILNGKIVAECDCEKVEEIELLTCLSDSIINGENRKIDIKDLLRHSCLTYTQLEKYLKHVDETKYTFTQVGYALHLSNLNIFDKPLTFERDCIYKSPYTNELLLKAPQNMCRAYDRFGNKYILISIRPEWLCKILNGEKTIEVRKQIVKELKELIKDDK